MLLIVHPKQRHMSLSAASVYLLRCADGSLYCGITTKPVEERVSEHNHATFAGYTARRRPVVLLWSEEFSDIADAVATERRIKGWSRAKKLALAAQDWAGVQALAVAYERRK